MLFQDRVDAGRQLASLLARYREEAPLVLGLPRGGVPVAAEIARALDAPLDIWGVRKLGVPAQPELGMGAIAEGGTVYVDEALVAEIGVTPRELERVAARESAELQRRLTRFRAGRPPPALKGRTVILVDDGIATGGTARAAARAIRAAGAKRLILATPVAAAQSAAALQGEVDELVCVTEPEALWAIGAWYEDFRQVSDEEVVELLEQHASRRAGPELTAE